MSDVQKPLPDRLGELFASARQKILGDDYWIPTEHTDVVPFPPSLLPSHKAVLPLKKSDGPFQVVEGSYRNKPVLYHVTFTWSLEDDIETFSIFRSNELQQCRDVYESCLKCHDLFIKSGAQLPPDAKYVIKSLLAELRGHPLWLAGHIAARMGNKKFFEQIKEHKEELAKALNTAGQPEANYPLQIAIENNQLELVKFLLDVGADLTKTDAHGNNVMHYAAKSSGEMLDFLAEHPESIKLQNSLNNEGSTPLFEAIRFGNPLCIMAFMKMGAELNIGSSGRSPLLAAVVQNNDKAKKVIKTLIEANPECLDDADPLTGNTPLHMAISKIPLSGLLMSAASKLDLNVRNKLGQSPVHMHTHRADLGALITLAAYDADLNAKDSDGNTPLHIAVSKSNLELTKALLVMGSDVNLANNNHDSARHLTALLNTKEKHDIIRCLDICAAERCPAGKVGCTAYCADIVARELAHSYSEPVVEGSEIKTAVQELADYKNSACMKEMHGVLSNSENRPRLLALLSLDGGGIRGLVIMQILLELEKQLGENLWDYIDWSAGTSTGSFVEAALACGKTMRQCQQLYLRFKDQIFDGWARPYNTATLEEFIKDEMGEETRLGDIEYPRIVVTTVLADKHPVKLKLLRNYQLPLEPKLNEELGYDLPKEQRLWRALRCSSAAPTYFSSVDGKYLDGGLIANNPGLDLLTEVQQWNTALDYKSIDPSNKCGVGLLLSVGTGKVPETDCDNLDFDGSAYKSAQALSNLGIVMVDQVSEREGSPVDRARAWCHNLGAPYFRFSTTMSQNIELDTRSDSEVVTMMWETQEYMYSKRQEVIEFCELLRAMGPNSQRKQYFDV